MASRWFVRHSQKTPFSFLGQLGDLLDHPEKLNKISDDRVRVSEWRVTECV